jgi:hypothetical protein
MDGVGLKAILRLGLLPIRCNLKNRAERLGFWKKVVSPLKSW